MSTLQLQKTMSSYLNYNDGNGEEALYLGRAKKDLISALLRQNSDLLDILNITGETCVIPPESLCVYTIIETANTLLKVHEFRKSDEVVLTLRASIRAQIKKEPMTEHAFFYEDTTNRVVNIPGKTLLRASQYLPRIDSETIISEACHALRKEWIQRLSHAGRNDLADHFYGIFDDFEAQLMDSLDEE